MLEHHPAGSMPRICRGARFDDDRSIDRSRGSLIASAKRSCHLVPRGGTLLCQRAAIIRSRWRVSASNKVLRPFPSCTRAVSSDPLRRSLDLSFRKAELSHSAHVPSRELEKLSKSQVAIPMYRVTSDGEANGSSPSLNVDQPPVCR